MPLSTYTGTLSIPEGCFRNVPCALTLISTFLLLYFVQDSEEYPEKAACNKSLTNFIKAASNYTSTRARIDLKSLMIIYTNRIRLS